MAASSVQCAIALGSNLGDRAPTLRAALHLIDHLDATRVVRVSSFHETEPIGGPAGQGRYLNAAAILRTGLSAGELLDGMLTIEARLGRIREPHERNGPRTIDLDLLLFGDAVLGGSGADGGGLTVPHPRMHERRFVLAPLAEIAPSMVHPVLGRTVKELLDAVAAQAPMHPQTLAGGR